MYLEVYESYFYLIQPNLPMGNFFKTNYVGEEQGIEALDNCDPEPEHRLLYQVDIDRGGMEVLWAISTTCFFHASWLKNKHI